MTLANAPAILRSADHHYTYEGVTYPGVTSILRVLDKSDALVGWASRMTAEAAVRLADSLPTMIASVGAEGAIKALTARSSWQRDESAALGTEVHALAERYVKGDELTDVTPKALARITGYAEWWQASGWRLVAAECMVIKRYPWTGRGYGGTFDLYAIDRNGKKVMADIKTGKAVYHEAVLQQAAYGSADVVEIDGQLFSMVEPDRYVILHATAEGTREIDIEVGKGEIAAFEACLDLHEWRESTKGKRL